MRKKLRRYLKESSLDKQIRVMFISISLFLLALGYIFSKVSQKELKNSYQLHVLPLKDYNEIRNIYEINILDTVKEMQSGYIAKEDAKEVLQLTQKLLKQQWQQFLQRGNSHQSVNKILDKKREDDIYRVLSSLDLLITAISYLDDKKINEVIENSVRPDIFIALERIDDLVQEEVVDMEESILKQNQNFNDTIIYLFPFLLFFYLLLLAYLKNILTKIKNTNRELLKSRNEIQQVNDTLEEKVALRTKELETAKQHAEELTKTKSAFLANMSHEIRTPMNGILGMSHLVLKTYLNEKQKNYLLKIQSSATTLLQIINDILDISKIEAGKLTIEKANFDLFQMIENVISLIELKADEKKLELTVDYDTNVGKEFYGDSLRISQILTNLLSNSIKFTHEGEIGLKVTKLSETNVQFEVRDTGIGLTQSQMDKIFDSFTQADATTTKKYGGTGLGLSITKQLVELMNGSISVQSEVGLGTTFIFDIELKKLDTKESYTVFSNKKVLIVDDSPSWLEILTHLVSSFGLEVEAVDSGKKAIERLKNDKDSFDIILMDWNMPDLDGIETCKIMKEELKVDAQKMILVSSHKEEDITTNLEQKCSLVRFLHKPLNPSFLNDMLSEILLNKKINSYREQKDKSNVLEKNLKTLQGSNILLVDDNQINQEILLGLLEDSGINIDVANNGLEAVEKYENSKDKYELILMDIQMPLLDGYEATKRIRKQDADIPIIALTANAMKEDVDKAKKSGMDHHLNKPIEVEKLYETLLEFISTKKEDIDFILPAYKDGEDSLPEFETLDKRYALKLLLGNEKAYKRLLTGLLQYKEIDFDSLDDDKYKRMMHSLKGLTASAGALDIHELAKKLEYEKDEQLLIEFNKKLNHMINEIEIKVCYTDETKDKREINKDEKETLFIKLKEAVFTKRIQNCKPILSELSSVVLDEDEETFVKEITKLIEKFKFKEAMEKFN